MYDILFSDGKHPGFGFVQFTQKWAANTAMQKTNGTKLLGNYYAFLII